MNFVTKMEISKARLVYQQHLRQYIYDWPASTGHIGQLTSCSGSRNNSFPSLVGELGRPQRIEHSGFGHLVLNND